MEDKKDSMVKQEVEQPVLEPVGVRIIGEADPRTLTEEQFRSSPDLLFHGASRNFRFSNRYDYRSPEYYEKSDGSQTLGEGFYTTAERDTAENYSVVRQIGQEVNSVVVEVLPHQAKVLDLRAKADSTKTTPVSEEFFSKWYDRYRTYFQERNQDENLPWHVKMVEADYMEYLVKLKELKPDPELRLMLGTAPRGNLRLPLMNLPSPPWMKLFSNFMTDEGYDGLVYNEGGEGRNAKSHTSYVFYNLEKVGTFESWKEASDMPSSK